ncbi:hypothetical protein [Agromyces sp. Soil535]|uniref:hypothetical protein n=1 Tax=Agromyces sp. Soil535 TaxID=1736390 RepID=UPI0007009391|nr:hypothetical protein [Agromyces sp. Soil535]KRE31294.1 hypothetical protein ASG80_02260 [Agromyces sp. Soil535]
MDDPAHERMRRLQRLAYGAVASDAERTAALAELETLRNERAEAEAVSERAEAPPLDPGNAPHPPASTGALATATESGASRGGAAKPLKWAIAVGVVALLVGVAVGWQAGGRMSTSEPSAAAVSTAPELDGFMIPIDQTAVLKLFESTPGPADVPQSATPDPRIAPTDYRLLVTRADGVALYVSRLDGGADVCAVLAIPGVFTTGSCTRDGQFSEGGLTVEAFVQGDVGLIRGIIHPNGTVELTPSHYVPGPIQVAEG